MRRLPVFFVLDVSESMAGDNLRHMDDGLSAIVGHLRQDPHALETVYLSVIAFAGQARTLAPLVEVATFYPPRLPLGSGTNLGAALHVLMDDIERSVVRSSPEKKGDWKPIVYLFTDGKPTDAVETAIERWQRDFNRRAYLVAVALGPYADMSILRRLTENVIQFQPQNTHDFARFIQWVTASVTTQSRSIGDGQGDRLPLAKLDDSILKLVKDLAPAADRLMDQDCVVLVGRCQKSKKPYLMKYDRVNHAIATQDFAMHAHHFELTGCFPIGEDYFDWSDKVAPELTVNTAELIGVPGCPHCGNPTAFAQCACGGLMCAGGAGDASCPWCGKTVHFSAGESEDFEVRRGRG